MMWIIVMEILNIENNLNLIYIYIYIYLYYRIITCKIVRLPKSDVAQYKEVK